MKKFLFLALPLIGAALTPSAPALSADACVDQDAVILSARTPEVDLFDAPSGGNRVMSISKADFPACLPILAQTEARMLKVSIEGTEYWVAPHMVQFRAGHIDPPVCRTLVAGGDETRTGTTRGLGEGC
jgi:hypothetical protein